MTFRELIERLAIHIGQHQMPVNASATELRGLIDSGAVHYELVTQVVTAIYTGNRCQRLADAVTRDATFESIEPIRMAVLRSPKTDVDAYAFMESLCAAVAPLFDENQPPTRPAAVSGKTAGRLYTFRRRLRFS